MSDNQIQKSNVKQFMAQPSTIKRVEELLGDRSSQFMTSVSSMVGSDAKLSNCEPTSLFMACLTAAALDLPINKNLGFAHIIPYGNEAQFQMGWKGYVQLAQRTGQYKKIAATEVYEGQLVEEDPLLGNSYNWKNKISDTVIGYVAFIQLANGFDKELYMSDEDITKHADKYSKAYNHGRGYGPWKDNFSAMALKTVLKLLISKWGPMSVDMQKAVEMDSAVIKDDGTPSYIDADVSDIDVKASDDKKAAILAAHAAEDVQEVRGVGDDVSEIFKGAEVLDPPRQDTVKEKAAKWVANNKSKSHANNSSTNSGK